jgi:hypothetical protein
MHLYCFIDFGSPLKKVFYEALKFYGRSKNKNLDEFDCDVNFFGHADSHDSSHNPLFRVDVDEAFVDAHFPSVPSGCSFAAG